MMHTLRNCRLLLVSPLFRSSKLAEQAALDINLENYINLNCE